MPTWMAVLRSMGSPGAAAAGASCTERGLSPLRRGEARAQHLADGDAMLLASSAPSCAAMSKCLHFKAASCAPVRHVGPRQMNCLPVSSSFGREPAGGDGDGGGGRGSSADVGRQRSAGLQSC